MGVVAAGAALELAALDSGLLLSGASTLSPNNTTTKIAITVRNRPIPLPFILNTPLLESEDPDVLPSLRLDIYLTLRIFCGVSAARNSRAFAELRRAAASIRRGGVDETVGRAHSPVRFASTSGGPGRRPDTTC